MTVKDLHYYRRKFAPKSTKNPIGLNPNRSQGVAPHKSILLLSLIELIGRNIIRHNIIELSPDLIAAFHKFWSVLGIERKPSIGMPFYYLRSDGFWHFVANPGFEATVNSKAKFTSTKAIQQTVRYAYLDPELFEILQDSALRAELTLVLITSWFADKTEQIENSLNVDAFANLQSELLTTGGKLYDEEDIKSQDEQSSIVRDGAFRRIVTSAYDYRCALCGLRVFKGLDNIVDGAHIKPFSQFYDDRIDNGLALCKNHHWAFDRFWFGIREDYTLDIASALTEESPHAEPLRAFEGRKLILPRERRYLPRPDAIAWHYRVFRERNFLDT